MTGVAGTSTWPNEHSRGNLQVYLSKKRAAFSLVRFLLVCLKNLVTRPRTTQLVRRSRLLITAHKNYLGAVGDVFLCLFLSTVNMGATPKAKMVLEKKIAASSNNFSKWLTRLFILVAIGVTCLWLDGIKVCTLVTPLASTINQRML